MSHLATGLFLAAWFGPAARADTPLLREATRLMGSARWLPRAYRRRPIASVTRGRAPGMVIVVVRSPATLVQNYGETTNGNGKGSDRRSLLRLGSISKVFTTELLAGMAAEGKWRLTNPLQH